MFSFNFKGEYETPLLTLCTPIREELFIISECKGLTYTPIFDGLAELEFEVSSIFSNGEDTPYYSLIKKRKLIHAEGIGWFVIVQADENIDGSRPIKKVHCVSAEKTLDQYSINLMDGTHKFYDALQPEKSLLGAFIGQTDWKIGHIDVDLWNKYRTFEFPDDEGLYSFLHGDVEEAYGCVFEFDTEKKLVNAYVKGTLIDKTDIVLTFDNLIKKIDIQESDDDLVTALSVSGDNDLNIRTVNPLGTNTIYQFDYFKTEEWMSKGLIDALTVWEKKVEAQQKPYSSLLTSLKTENSKLITLQGQLTDLKAELDALEQVRTARIKGGKDLADITNKINAKQAEITAKQAEVDKQKAVVDSIRNQQLEINKSLRFEENFTAEQLVELQCYTNAATYTNDNYTITDNMSYAQIQEQSEALYQDSLKKLGEISVPNYSFDMDVVNFLFLIQYKPFIEQIRLGATVNAEVKKGFWVEPMLVKIVVDYDQPDNCKLVFSDSFRLVDEYCVFDDYDKEYAKSAKTIHESKAAWDKATSSGAVDFVNDMRKDGLNLALTSVLNADNQSLVINKHGLTGRVQREDGSFDPEQVKLVNNLLVFTDDNWQSAKAALGKVKMPNSENYGYGLIADVIIGQLVASSELVISNESNTFKVDANGAELINAYFKLKTSNGRSQITLDPRDSSAIRLQTDTGSGLKDKFYVDLTGKIVADDIVTKSGTIGGWNIKENGLFSNWGDYIRSDGYGKLSLMTYTPSSARFDGTIYAKNLGDQVQHNNMGNNSVDTEQLFNGAVTNPIIEDGAVSEDKLDWHVRNLFAELIRADEILAGKIGSVEERVEEVWVDTLDAIDVKAKEITSEYLKVTGKLEGKIADIERLYVKEAEIGSIIANQITTNGIAAKNIILDGWRCGRVSALISIHSHTTTAEAITSVKIVKKGLGYDVVTSKGDFVTSVGLVNATSKPVVGVNR